MVEDQSILPLIINLVILITFTLHDLLMLLGENWCWSLLGPKGLIVPVMCPYSLLNLRNHLSMTKSKLCVIQICLLGVIWNVARNKHELWKTVKLTSFQKPQSQYVSIGSLSKSLRRPLLRRSWMRCPGESTSRSSPNSKLGSCSLAFAMIYQQQNSMVLK